MSDSDDERGFWSRRVFAVAAVLVLLQAPTIVSQPTLAGMVGGVIGGVLASLALDTIADEKRVLERTGDGEYRRL